MGSFGENLRREREMRGVTLDEISAATKISVRLLQAIEAEDFSVLPGGIFTRSFIRAYAKYLGLDDNAVLAEYQMVAQPKADLNNPGLPIIKPLHTQNRPQAPAVVLLVAATLLAAGYALYRYSRRASEPPLTSIFGASGTTARAAPPAQAVASTPPPGASGGAMAASTSAKAGRQVAPPVRLPASATPGASARPGASFTEANSSDTDLVLQIAATERAWVAVDTDGKTALQRVLNPNEIQTLKAKQSFDVTTGNAQGVILTLNGETLKPLGRRGEVKSIHLTRDDLKNPAP